MQDKQKIIRNDWDGIGFAGSECALQVGIGSSQYSAKSAPNLSKNGFATNQIMARKSSQSCNHVYMDAMQDKQKSIGDEWAVIEITS